MKRSSDETESLVYAYGCGQPVAGWQQAEAENERCGMLWDRLVGIDRAADSETLAAARSDSDAIEEVAGRVDALIAQRRAELDRDARRAIRKKIIETERELWPLMSSWRKDHRKTLQHIEETRRARVIEARHESGLWWPNYNAVIARYETQRGEVRKRGRRLQLRDVAREDGCLSVQIQRTKTGLGAAPDEVVGGALSMLCIGAVAPVAHDPYAFRGDRRRASQTVVEMRVDNEGSLIRLPIWVHRPLPEDARIKSAQLTWRMRGERREFQLCLTVSRQKPIVESQARASGRVRIAIEPAGRSLRVATVETWGGECRVRSVDLEPELLRRMDRADHLPSLLADDSAPVQARIRARLELPGLRAGIQRARREAYRLAARTIAMAHARLVIETPALSEVAFLDRGTDTNSLRQRACAHSFIAELQHQCRKHGCAVEVIVAERDASAKVPKRVQRRRNNGLRERVAAESGALENWPMDAMESTA